MPELYTLRDRVAELEAEVKKQNGWAHDLMRERDRYRKALDRIASCASYAPGDCPDIAKTALATALRQERGPDA